MIAGIACEVFAFSHGSALPVVAQDVLKAGASGLGTLNSAVAIGGTTAVLLLSLMPGRVRREPLLGLAFVVYGLSLLAVSSATNLATVAAILVVTGLCAGAFDVLQQTLIQLAVPEEQRGRAVGIWVSASARPRSATGDEHARRHARRTNCAPDRRAASRLLRRRCCSYAPLGIGGYCERNLGGIVYAPFADINYDDSSSANTQRIGD